MQSMERDETQTEETDTAGTAQCGAEHRSGARCQYPKNHERWAHAYSTTELDGDGYTQTTIAWVDWNETSPKILDTLERLRQRRLSRAR